MASAVCCAVALAAPRGVPVSCNTHDQRGTDPKPPAGRRRLRPVCAQLAPAAEGEERSAAHEAARASPPSPAAIRRLARAGVNLNAPCGPSRYTPVHLAILQQFDPAALESTLAALLAAGASAHQPTAEGDSPLHLCCQRARRGQAAAGAIELLIAQGGADPNRLNARGQAPLHICLGEPLSSAALGAMRCLLAHGACPSLPCAGVPPLHAAATFADGDTARWVIEALAAAGAAVHAPAAADGSTAMHAAATNLAVYTAALAPRVRGKRAAGAEAIAALAAAGASPRAAAAGGRQPLHAVAAASAHDARSVAAALSNIAALVAVGADANAPDAAGRTPLHYAIKNGSALGPAAISALVQAGASARPLLDML